MTTELDDRIRATVHTIAQNAADPIPWPDVSVPRNARKPIHTRGRRNFMAVTAAATLVLGAVGLAAALRHGPPDTIATSSGTVIHSVFEFSQSSRGCPANRTPGSSSVARARIDTWYDPLGKRYRSRQTYANGSSFDSISFGISEHPSSDFKVGRVYSRGISRLAASCRGLAASPTLPGPETSTSASRKFGRAIAGTVKDSRGRDAWRRRSVGTRTFTIDASRPLVATETTTSLVRPHTGELLEIRSRVTIPTVGMFTGQLVTIRRDRIHTPRELFATSGYQAATSPVPQLRTSGRTRCLQGRPA